MFVRRFIALVLLGASVSAHADLLGCHDYLLERFLPARLEGLTQPLMDTKVLTAAGHRRDQDDLLHVLCSLHVSIDRSKSTVGQVVESIAEVWNSLEMSDSHYMMRVELIQRALSLMGGLKLELPEPEKLKSHVKPPDDFDDFLDMCLGDQKKK